MLGFCSTDGKIHLVGAKTKTTIRKLEGHIGPLNDFDWSSTNELILSVGCDKTIRIWDTNAGNCIRTIESPEFIPNNKITTQIKIKNKQQTTPTTPITVSNIPTCCLFHPLNNNIFLIGFSTGFVQFFNLSTGKTFLF